MSVCVCVCVPACMILFRCVLFLLPHTLLLMIDLIDINFQVLKQKYVSMLYPNLM